MKRSVLSILRDPASQAPIVLFEMCWAYTDVFYRKLIIIYNGVSSDLKRNIFICYWGRSPHRHVETNQGVVDHN
jgi:hypothetical protein